MNSTLRKLVVPGVLAAGIGGGLTLAEAARDPVADAAAQQVASRAPDPGSPQGLSTAFRAASSTALPGVVHVQVETAARTVSSQVPDEFRGTPLEGMFGRPQRQGPSSGSGSGFVVSADGYVVTNNHVVEGTSRVRVVLNDKREFDARVVGRDPNTDIAVLKIDARGLPTVRMGDSDALQTGDWVLALGYPLSLGQTTTAGIVSAKGRSIGIMQNTAGASAVEHYIQTDAAINPGNSGGPLVDLQGRVVGVNSAIASPTGFYSGYGFAVPINLARRVADDLIRYGVVHRPMLGVEIRDASTADAEVFRLPSPDGAVVASDPRGAAREAGLELGDVIVAIDGAPVRNTGDLMETVMRKNPGDRVAVDYVRYGDRRRATVKLAEFERKPLADAAREDEASGDVESVVGFRAADVTPQIARQLELSQARGVVVSAVDPTHPAAGALFTGLLVERFNGRPVESAAQLREAASRVKPGEVVSIVGRRADGSGVIANYRTRS
jgi:serine protease Do